MIYQRLQDNQQKGIRQIVATITQVKGSAPREVGAKMLISKDSIFGTIGGGSLEQFVIGEARRILSKGGAQKAGIPLCSKVGQCCGGYVEIFFDIVEIRPQLFVFGAGHVAQALLDCLNGTEFDVHLIDERAEWIEKSIESSTRLGQLSLKTYLQPPIQWLSLHAEKLEDNYVLVMTHDHGLDQDIIEAAILKSPGFLGLIGSQTKRERFVKRLTEKGISLEALSRLHCPVGKSFESDYKSKLPKAVAMSMAFQLLEIEMRKVKPIEENLDSKDHGRAQSFELPDLMDPGL